MFIWIPNWSFLNPIIKSLYRILIFVNMVFQGKKYENAKLKKYIKITYILHDFTFINY